MDSKTQHKSSTILINHQEIKFSISLMSATGLLGLTLVGSKQLPYSKHFILGEIIQNFFYPEEKKWVLRIKLQFCYHFPTTLHSVNELRYLGSHIFATGHFSLIECE